MTADLRAALRTLASALPAGTPVPVPAEQLLDLLGETPTPAVTPESVIAAQEQLLTAQEAADRLQVPLRYIYDHADRLPFVVRIGRKIRANPTRLARYMERHS